MRQTSRAIVASLVGLKLCAGDRKRLQLSLIPWLTGGALYLGTLWAVFRYHSAVLELFIAHPAYWYSWIGYALAWLAAWAVLLVAATLVSVAATLLLTGFFQAAIAESVLRSYGIPIPESGPMLKGVTRSIGIEAKKLVFLVPFMTVSLFLGFIPALAPIGFFLASWLIGYQFIDLPLDIMRVPVRRRVGFALRSPLVFAGFGAALTTAWAVPFLGMILTPAAAAGAAWLCADRTLFQQIQPAEPATGTAD